MTHALRVVCRPAASDGFALAGVRCVPAADATETAAVVSRLAEEGSLGVLLVEDVLYRALPEELREGLERRPLPVVIPFPGPAREEQPSAEAELVELLRHAIGYRVRLR
jgi:vacuolar-type H+-ATPase subunit F/Vma7